MSERATPLTDEAEDRCAQCGLNFVLAVDARRLGRGRSKLVETLEAVLNGGMAGKYARSAFDQARALLAKLKAEK